MAGAEDMAKRGLMVIVSQVKMFCGCQWWHVLKGLCIMWFGTIYMIFQVEYCIVTLTRARSIGTLNPHKHESDCSNGYPDVDLPTEFPKRLDSRLSFATCSLIVGATRRADVLKTYDGQLCPNMQSRWDRAQLTFHKKLESWQKLKQRKKELFISGSCPLLVVEFSSCRHSKRHGQTWGWRTYSYATLSFLSNRSLISAKLTAKRKWRIHSLKHGICIALCRVIHIGIIQEILYAK
jgi:hypothetical protein